MSVELDSVPELDFVELAALATERGQWRDKNSRSYDQREVCTRLIYYWRGAKAPTAEQIASEGHYGVHGVRLYLGDGVGGKGGLQLDQAPDEQRLPADGDGAKPRTKQVATYPATRRNWSKVLVALGVIRDGQYEPDNLAVLDIDEDELARLVNSVD